MLHARGLNGARTVQSCRSKYLFMFLPSDGLYGLSTAHKLWPLRRGLPVVAHDLNH